METTSDNNDIKLIDCGNYKVKICKSFPKDRFNSTITFSTGEGENAYTVIVGTTYNIDWNEEKDGSRLDIIFSDIWNRTTTYHLYTLEQKINLFDSIKLAHGIFKDKLKINDTK